MHIISKKALREFWVKCPDACESLNAWFHETKAATWSNSAELKAKYRSASVINAECVVFNICGNKYRLVVRINYAYKTVFIRFVGSHREYDQIDVENI